MTHSVILFRSGVTSACHKAIEKNVFFLAMVSLFLSFQVKFEKVEKTRQWLKIFTNYSEIFTGGFHHLFGRISTPVALCIKADGGLIKY